MEPCLAMLNYSPCSEHRQRPFLRLPVLDLPTIVFNYSSVPKQKWKYGDKSG